MVWIDVIMLVVVVWGGSSVANSLHQIARDVEGIKAMLSRAEIERTTPK
jgi:hypothetical protein